MVRREPAKEFLSQAGLAEAALGCQRDNAWLSAASYFERRFEDLHFSLAADECAAPIHSFRPTRDPSIP